VAGSARSSAADDVLGLRTLLALGHVEGDRLALDELPVAVAGDVGAVRKDVRSAAVLGDEPEALLGVEPLHGAAGHALSFDVSPGDPAGL
jgi:hypothetical protein